ncbi:MAG: DNA/RNA non-specific endonuclease [Oligoflexales bacterium]|nr:DNA/RNA non-specific endonuclease [Oligoflexales bacterium]
MNSLLHLKYLLSLLGISCVISLSCTGRSPDLEFLTTANSCRDQKANFKDNKPTLGELVSTFNRLGWPKKAGEISAILPMPKIEETPKTTQKEFASYRYRKINNDQHLLGNDFFISKLNCESRIPEWTAHLLHKNRVVKNYCRLDKFTDDPIKSANSLQNCEHSHDDYTSSGYDRGHLAPALDFSGYSQSAISESNYTSNIAPQVGAGFNRHLWLSLESATRDWGRTRNGPLLIITGTALESRSILDGINKRAGIRDHEINDFAGKRIGKSEKNVVVPAYYYKIILDLNVEPIAALAFVMRNIDHRAVDYCDPDVGPYFASNWKSCAEDLTKPDNNTNIERHLTSIDEIEEISGIDFFTKAKIDEARVSELWPISNLSLSEDE